MAIYVLYKVLFQCASEHSLNAWSHSFLCTKNINREGEGERVKDEIGKQSFVGKYAFYQHTHESRVS